MSTTTNDIDQLRSVLNTRNRQKVNKFRASHQLFMEAEETLDEARRLNSEVVGLRAAIRTLENVRSTRLQARRARITKGRSNKTRNRK